MADILTEFCLRLKWSRYNSAYRAEVIYSAVTGLQESAGPGGQGREVLALAHHHLHTSHPQRQADQASEGGASGGGQEATAGHQGGGDGRGQPQEEADWQRPGSWRAVQTATL